MNTEMTTDRAEATWSSSLNVVAGIWLIISPFVLLYANRTAQNNDIVVGAVITLFAVIRAILPGAGTTGLSWLNGLWGVWLIVASFVLGYGGVARPNEIILGIIVLVFSLWSAVSAGFGRTATPMAR
jgi:hypothetical protein